MRKAAVLLTSLIPILVMADEQPLRVAVGGGFHPTMNSLSSRLSHELGMKVEITSVPIESTYQQLIKAQAPYDLVILANPEQMQNLVKHGSIYADSILEVARSQIVLWCPNPKVLMRVSLNDTLNEPTLTRLGLSPTNSPVGQLVAESIDLKPIQSKIKRANHSLDAWRLARSGKTECAFTMLGLMQPSDRYSIIPNRNITLITGIPRSNRSPEKAQRVLQFLNSPLIKARIKNRGYS